MFGLPALVIALCISAPALWAGLVKGTMDSTDSLIRFLIAYAVASAAIAVLRSVTANYGRPSANERPDKTRKA